MRSFISNFQGRFAASLFAALMATPLFCAAQSPIDHYWPQENLQFHIIAEAGSEADQVARMAAARIQAIYGRTTTLDNLPGPLGPGRQSFFEHQSPASAIYILQTSYILKDKSYDSPSERLRQDIAAAGYQVLKPAVGIPYVLVGPKDRNAEIKPRSAEAPKPLPSTSAVRISEPLLCSLNNLQQLLGAPVEPDYAGGGSRALNNALKRSGHPALVKASAALPLVENDRLTLLGAAGPETFAQSLSTSSIAGRCGNGSADDHIVFLVSDKLPASVQEQINQTLARLLKESALRRQLESQYMYITISPL